MSHTKAARVKDLTVMELQALITGTVKHTIEDLVEDLQALSSKKFLKSIDESRTEYRAGKTKNLKDVL